jgi:hypothetical protein
MILNFRMSSSSLRETPSCTWSVILVELWWRILHVINVLGGFEIEVSILFLYYFVLLGFV